LGIKLSELLKKPVLEKVIFHSVDLSLYQVSVTLDGEEVYVTDEDGRFLRSRNLADLRKVLQSCRTWRTVLRHASAFDEMVGGAEKVGQNMLEVRLEDNNFDRDLSGI
jgi:hypothetical protein